MVQAKSQKFLACMQITPGPSYLLPTLIGDRAHDPRSVHYKNPAFSFGTRCDKYKGTTGPGPSHFIDSNIQRDGARVNPQYSLGGRQKIKDQPFTPAPATISDKAMSFKYTNPPNWPFGNNHVATAIHKIPGPNSYKPGNVAAASTKAQAPSYSLQSSSKLEKTIARATYTPGPAAYPPINLNIFKNQGPSMTVTKFIPMVGNQSQNPGPAAHMGDKTPVQPGILAYSFGVKHSPCLTVVKSNDPSDE